MAGLNESVLSRTNDAHHFGGVVTLTNDAAPIKRVQYKTEMQSKFSVLKTTCLASFKALTKAGTNFGRTQWTIVNKRKSRGNYYPKCHIFATNFEQIERNRDTLSVVNNILHKLPEFPYFCYKKLHTVVKRMQHNEQKLSSVFVHFHSVN
jgi:hypothetical protein